MSFQRRERDYYPPLRGGKYNQLSFQRKLESIRNSLVKNYYVYILASGKNGTLYIGVTSDLIKRIYEHRTGSKQGFAKKYGCCFLVHYEAANDVHEAIKREKNLKAWQRQWKIDLIEENNPDWEDLFDDLLV